MVPSSDRQKSLFRTSSADPQRLKNIEGNAQALTVLSPVRGSFRAVKLWIRLRAAGIFPSLLGPLPELSFIHFARWSLLSEVPYNGPPQKREQLNYTYLMFTSNFNGTWDQYIDAFSYTVPKQISRIWGSSFGFPGPMPVQPFKDYIRRNEFVANHYYSAYPDVTTTMIRSALELRRCFEEFQRDTAGYNQEDFQDHFWKFLTKVQGIL